jgi:hypothetical protein
MRLYTIQHKSVVDTLQKKGIYKTNRKFICEPTFKAAYQWLSQMAKKHRGWQEARPVWAWHQRPDMRNYRFFKDPEGPPSRRDYLITLEVPDELVLLSEFGLWHCVLNNYYVYVNQKQEKAWTKLLKPYNDDLHKAPKKIHKLKEASWEQILFLNPKSFNKFNKQYTGTIELQAILPFLKKEWVVSIKPIKMKNTHK